tara:strand:- start:148 stop:756 length:609 start_codon:yes stop_codon:yes gene_type:complete
MTAKIKLNAASGGGSFSLQAPSSSSNNRVFTLPDSADATLLTSTTATGKILQVVQTVKTDTTSQGSASTWNDISGVSVTITPSSTSNKILIIPDLALGGSDMSGYHLVWRLLRGSTPVGVSTSATNSDLVGTGGMHRAANGANAYFFGTSKMFLDSPSTTSATTYKCQWSADDGGATLYLNRRGNDTGAGGITTITAMEVAA